jgi:ATP-dependent Clp protease ATP-binding subunit ClpA
VSSGQRIVRLASEVADAPTPSAALRRVTELRRELAAFERQQVARALAEGGTFASIARELGLSRQAVHRRFRDLTSAAAPLVTTSDARRVLLYAREEALALGAATPTGGHVIVATLRAADLPAAAVLRDAGATLDRVRTDVEATATGSARFQSHSGSGDFRSLLRAAAECARERGDGRIEVEHLLLGTLQDDDGAAARTLRALGVDVDAVRDELGAGIESRLA